MVTAAGSLEYHRMPNADPMIKTQCMRTLEMFVITHYHRAIRLNGNPTAAVCLPVDL